MGGFNNTIQLREAVIDTDVVGTALTDGTFACIS